MFNKIKHFKDLRDKAKDMQTQLAQETAEGQAAWGKIKIIINGNQEVLNISIDPELLTDSKKLEDALKEAFNDAVKKIQRIIAMKMHQMGGLSGLGL